MVNETLHSEFAHVIFTEVFRVQADARMQYAVF